MRVQGNNGQIELFEDRLVISRKGALAFLTQGLKGDKSIPFAAISAVQFKVAGILVNGYIQFTLAGGRESRGGIFDATKDENSVCFGQGKNEAFKELRRTIEARIAASHGPQQAGAPSAADEIKKLAALRDEGILTDDEFQQKKRTLLGL